jgi:hypothetical protein
VEELHLVCDGVGIADGVAGQDDVALLALEPFDQASAAMASASKAFHCPLVPSG